MSISSQTHSISSHINGRPRWRLLFNTVFFYFSMGVFLMVMGFLMYQESVEQDEQTFLIVALVLVLLGFVAIVPGIYQLVPETVVFDANGITLAKGSKQRMLAWSQVKEVAIVSSIGYYKVPTTNPTIRIRTDDMTMRLYHWKYGVKDLKAIAVPMATFAKRWNVRVLDELSWLPDQLYTVEERFKSKIEEYRLFVRIGCYLGLAGLLMFPLAFFVELFAFPALMCLFIGGFIAFAGGVGVHDEKSKLALYEYEKNR